MELLCQQLENLQKTNCEMAQNYKTQLCALKSQVRKISVSLFSVCITRNLYMPYGTDTPLRIWEKAELCNPNDADCSF